MKALIRKHGCTPTTEEQDEVFLEPSWPKWVNADGRPLTDENYGYALCEDCPENVSDLSVKNFMINSETYTETDEYGNPHERTRWTAVYVAVANGTDDKTKEIEELKRKLAALESDM